MMQLSKHNPETPSRAIADPSDANSVPTSRWIADHSTTAWVYRFLSAQSPISREDIGRVVYFSFVTELFETLVCEKTISLSKLEEVVQQFQLQGGQRSIDYHNCLAAYRKHYLNSDGVTSWRFREVCFHSHEEALFVRSVLEDQGTQPTTSILAALLLLTYRYRSCLFRGNTSWSMLPSRIPILTSASALLMQFLDCWQDGFWKDNQTHM
ncbi:hypothetical protein O77CONTIG1_00239 [Leptolyngbya sp. O-77]|nr:hypothetical protein O77CONTIG1_00239 [Leptolyngbya sp. O-77]